QVSEKASQRGSESEQQPGPSTSLWVIRLFVEICASPGPETWAQNGHRVFGHSRTRSAQRSGFDRRERAQMFDGGGNDLKNVVNIGVGDGFEQAKAEAGAGAVAVYAHGEQNMAWFGSSGVAGGAARDGDAFKIEGDYQ